VGSADMAPANRTGLLPLLTMLLQSVGADSAITCNLKDDTNQFNHTDVLLKAVDEDPLHSPEILTALRTELREERLTPIQAAMLVVENRQQRYDLILQLLRDGAHPDEPMVSDGNTPLHLAAKYGDLAIVERLLDYGADSQRQNKKGLTAIAIAKQAANGVGYPQIAEVLEEFIGEARFRVGATRCGSFLLTTLPPNEADMHLGLGGMDMCSHASQVGS